ncbi:unnamed protein product [Pocillopora meandrina]|uniref:Reverse transcriptase zinc-binding domain-containing protein n=1 Tax=Pocillopora meandrina TaxID=46732 RepID=A0AAU9XX75_9CNID|nr:unnamed protein product [Pocillopora meandrina]
MLINFLELKTLYRPNYLSDLLLFNNKEIKIDGNSIFYSNWSEKAVLSIQDLLDCNGKFLSFQTFQQRYNIKCSTSYKVSGSIVTDLKKINSKDYYQLYVNATKIEPTGQKKWLKDLNLKNFNWNLAFTQVSKTCKENKLSHPERVICLDSKSLHCNESDSILHSFVDCEEAMSFFDKVISWFNKTNNAKKKYYLNSTIAYSSPNTSYIVKN